MMPERIQLPNPHLSKKDDCVRFRLSHVYSLVVSRPARRLNRYILQAAYNMFLHKMINGI